MSKPEALSEPAGPSALPTWHAVVVWYDNACRGFTVILLTMFLFERIPTWQLLKLAEFVTPCFGAHRSPANGWVSLVSGCRLMSFDLVLSGWVLRSPADGWVFLTYANGWVNLVSGWVFLSRFHNGAVGLNCCR